MNYLLLNSTIVFFGSFKGDTLSSDYTCSDKEKIPSGGVLLRFYALLLAHERNNNIVKLEGGMSGGIPAIEDGDSKAVIAEKTLPILE